MTGNNTSKEVEKIVDELGDKQQLFYIEGSLGGNKVIVIISFKNNERGDLVHYKIDY